MLIYYLMIYKQLNKRRIYLWYKPCWGFSKLTRIHVGLQQSLLWFDSRLLNGGKCIFIYLYACRQLHYMGEYNIYL